MKVYLYKNKKYFKQKFSKDIYFDSYLLNKFLNILTRQGKKHVTLKEFSKFLILNKKKFNKPFLFLFIQLFKKINPVFDFGIKRIGDVKYEFPIPIQLTAQYRRALKWFVEGLSVYSKKIPLHEKLKSELLNFLVFEKGALIKKQEQYFKTIVENRAYAHYRWR